MQYRPGDIVVCRYPYTAGESGRPRPAVVVAIPESPEGLWLYWVCMITASAEKMKSDIPIRPGKQSGLDIACVVRPGKIATIEAGIIRDKIGELPKTSLETLRTKIKKLVS